jgi:hypothetical protein
VRDYHNDPKAFARDVLRFEIALEGVKFLRSLEYAPPDAALTTSSVPTAIASTTSVAVAPVTTATLYTAALTSASITSTASTVAPPTTVAAASVSTSAAAATAVISGGNNTAFVKFEAMPPDAFVKFEFVVKEEEGSDRRPKKQRTK